MNETWQKRLLLLTAAWNVFGGVSALFDPAQHFALLYTSALSLDDPLQAFFYRCMWVNVAAWGIAYFVAALVPQARKAVLPAGGAGKLAYAAACMPLFSSGIGNGMLLLTALVDVAMVIMFAVILLSNRSSGAHGFTSPAPWR